MIWGWGSNGIIGINPSELYRDLSRLSIVFS